jgi:hypothetical protein
MLNSIFAKDESMPAEVRTAAVEGLPGFLGSDTGSALAEASMQLAAAFGDQGDFRAVVADKSSARDESERKLVTSFQKNLELLVQKTWVEKADETLKEEMLFRINTLCANLSRYDYHTSLSEFLPVLKDVVFLLFGSLSKHDNFLEYAVRIDPDFGFFWYYITTMPSYKDWSEEKCRLAVLLGICFLANF